MRVERAVQSDQKEIPTYKQNARKSKGDACIFALVCIHIPTSQRMIINELAFGNVGLQNIVNAKASTQAYACAYVSCSRFASIAALFARCPRFAQIRKLVGGLICRCGLLTFSLRSDSLSVQPLKYASEARNLTDPKRGNDTPANPRKKSTAIAPELENYTPARPHREGGQYPGMVHADIATIT